MMVENDHRVIQEFQEEHRKVRDLLLDLSDAIKEDDVETAREKLEKVNRLAGPHFRYEEEALYPALVQYFGENKVFDLIGEHDKGIERSGELLELVQKDSIPDEKRESVTELVAPLFVHVSDCEGLTIYMEEMSDETLDKIEENFERAWDEEIPLLEYDDTIRKSPEQNVKAF